MVEKTNKHKVTFSEEDAATLIQRYEATTVLTLLQEVALYPPRVKIDWNELVKNTSTGISNAREYQMLWRHLAYRDALPEKLEDGAEPLNDDSDLDCELEAIPPTISETASEAAACVKVMITSGVLSESSPSSSTIEAPLTINVPVCHSSRTPTENLQPSYLMQGTSIVFPVTVQRQTLPTVSSTEGIEAKGLAGGNMPYKRKRKAWSEEEDMQLRAAVQRCGEGNWATMLKGDDFPIKRSPTQLAQRWSILRKKDGNVNSGTPSTSSQYTAEQLATRHSLSLALDMPFKKLTATGMTDPARTSLNTSIKNPVQPGNTAEGSTVQSSPIPPQHPSQQALLGSCSSLAKSKAVPEKTLPKSNLNPNSAVRGTAVAAGAGVVSTSDTASPLKADQAINAAPTGSSIKSSIPAGSPSHNSKVHSNVPHVCTVLTATLVSSNSAVSVTPASGTSAVENPSPTTLSNILSEQNNRVNSVANVVLLKQEVNSSEKLSVSDTSLAPKERVKEDEALVMNITPSEEILEDRAAQSEEIVEDKAAASQEILEDKAVQSEEFFGDKTIPKNSVEYNNLGAVVMNSNLRVSRKTDETHPITIDNPNKERQESNQNKTMNFPLNNGGECRSVVNGSSEDQSMNEKHANLPSIGQDECSRSVKLPS